MAYADDLEHHSARVRMELDLAQRASNRAAAAAHMRLSSLHMRRLTELCGAGKRTAADFRIGSPAPVAALLYADRSGPVRHP